MPELTSVAALDSVAMIRGVLVIDNTGITELDAFNDVTQLQSLLRIRNNDALTSIEGFDALTSISFVQGDFSNFWGPAMVEIVDNDALLSIDAFHALQHLRRQQYNDDLGVLTVTGNPLLMSLQAFDALTGLSRLRISGSPMLSEVGPLAALTVAYDIAITGTQAGAILLPVLTTSESIVITDALIEELDLPVLTRAVLHLAHLPALTTIDAPAFVGGSSDAVEISDAPLLATLNLPVLTRASAIMIDGFAGTSLGSWPLMTTLAGLRITNSPALTALPDAPLLTALASGSIFNGLDVTNNDGLVQLGFTGLTQITACFDRDPNCDDFGGNCVCVKLAVRDNGALATCAAEAFGARVGATGDALAISGNNDAGTCH